MYVQSVFRVGMRYGHSEDLFGLVGTREGNGSGGRVCREAV